MTGLSVFRLFNFSTSLATFETEYTQFGDRLLQISGARITYNTQLNVSRLIQVEILNRDTNQYEPIERLKYYKFATDSWMCNGFDPFPSLVGDELVVQGEEPGVTTPLLLQTIVGDYLGSLNGSYDTSLQGRLVNDTSAMDALDWIQTEETCPGGTYWDERYLTCFDCPKITGVAFDQESFNFEDISGSPTEHRAQAVLFNDGEGPLSVSLRSKPRWVEFSSIQVDEPIIVEAGQRLSVDFAASALFLEDGTAQGAVSFGVLDSGNFPGCPGNDVTFEVFMDVDKPPELFKPDEILIVGFSLMAFLMITSVVFGAIVQYYREHRIVKAMQPEFLIALLCGIFLLASSIAPMSIEDEIGDPDGRNMACMATPWLLSMGFTVVMSALYAKLWRINKLFHNGNAFRRTAVTAKEAALPFAVLFGTNSLLLVLWTVIDPLKWEIRSVEGDKSRLYGTCSDFGTAGWVFLGLTVGLNLGALVLACLQAYKARKISSEYSESRSLGLALFCWLQILIVGGPVLFLISDDNPNAKYFLQVALIFVACLSMLVVIFGPIFVQLRAPKPEEGPVSVMHGNVRVSGLNYPTNPTAEDSSSMVLSSKGPGSTPLHSGSSDGFRPRSSDGFRLPPTPEEELPNSSMSVQASSGVEDAITEEADVEDKA
jgi:hypothetical protein